MSKMSAVIAGKSDDVNKYSVSGTRLCSMSDINWFVECCCAPLCPMEELCIGRRSAYPCSVWAKQFMDFGLQSIRGCVARYHLGGIVGWCPRMLVF